MGAERRGNQGGPGTRSTLGSVSADRHELHDLIDELPDDQVALALADVRRRLSKVPAGRSWPPKFFGAGVARDGRTDIAGNIDKYLSEGFGSPRS